MLATTGAVLLAVLVALGLTEVGIRTVAQAPPELTKEPQLLYQLRPEVGFLPSSTQQGWTGEGLTTINAMGLRGKLPETPAPADTVRILAVGGSTTFGWGVDDSETYPVELERLLAHEFRKRGVTVVNGGVTAYDLDHAARLLKQIAPVIQPQVVLVGVYWHDLPFDGLTPDGVARPDSGSGRSAISAGAAGRSAAFHLGNQPSRWDRLVHSSQLVYALRHLWPSVVGASSVEVSPWETALVEGQQSADVEKVWTATAAALKEIRDLGLSSGFTAGVVAMPIRAQLEADFPRADYQSRLREIADSLGLFVVDPLRLFAQQGNPDGVHIPYDRIHFSAQGNAEIADAAFEVLRVRPEFAPPPPVTVPATDPQVR